MKAVRAPRNWASPRPYSPAVAVYGWLHLSGHVPVDHTGATSGADVSAQTTQVLDNIERTLQACGASRADVVVTTIYLTDISDIDAVDAIYRRFFAGSLHPARTTVQVCALGRADFRVEISAIARLTHARAAT